MNHPVCKTCPYWYREFNAGDYGECRQGPPPESRHECDNLGDGEETNLEIGYWRSTKVSEWCGKHPDFPEYLLRIKKMRPSHPDELLDLPLCLRTMNALKSGDINSILRLCSKTERELLHLPGIGRTSLNEIKDALANRGLAIKTSSV